MISYSFSRFGLFCGLYFAFFSIIDKEKLLFCRFLVFLSFLLSSLFVFSLFPGSAWDRVFSGEQFPLFLKSCSTSRKKCCRFLRKVLPLFSGSCSVLSIFLWRNPEKRSSPGDNPPGCNSFLRSFLFEKWEYSLPLLPIGNRSAPISAPWLRRVCARNRRHFGRSGAEILPLRAGGPSVCPALLVRKCRIPRLLP